MERGQATTLHQIAVLLDDYLCCQFNLARNGRGDKGNTPVPFNEHERDVTPIGFLSRDDAVIIHKCLVVYDNYLCSRFGLARQAR